MMEHAGRCSLAAAAASLLVAALCSGASSDTRLPRSVSVQRQPWPRATVPYIVDSSFSGIDRQKIIDAMTQWERWTCVKFRPATTGEVAVRITLSTTPTECVTPVGYLGMDSMVRLGVQCMENMRSVIHELGHVLGLDHEHQHPDRQLTIYPQNVRLEMLPFFDTFSRSSVNTFGLPYDPLSIMHYGSKAFSSNGLPTMKHNDTVINALMGWTNSPSSLSDIPAVRQLYGCPQDSPLPIYGIECKDYDANCAKMGPMICTMTPDWAASTCLMTCSLCSKAGEIIVPVSSNSAVDASGCSDLPFCASSPGMCNGSYAAWAKVNCPCRCSNGGTPSSPSSAIGITSPAKLQQPSSAIGITSPAKLLAALAGLTWAITI